MGSVEEAKGSGRILRGIQSKIFHEPVARLEMGKECGKGGSDRED